MAEEAETIEPTLVHSVRDEITDRTGELLREAVAVAGNFTKADVVRLVEPGTEVEAVALLTPGGMLKPIAPEIFDQYRDTPKRIEGTATMTRLPSLIAHANRFKMGHTALFAVDDPARPSLTVVYDYHDKKDEPEPAFGAHRAAYQFPLSEEWKAWADKDGQQMTMGDFATFIEDRIVDVESNTDGLNDDMQQFVKANRGKIATPTALIELSRGLSVHENSVVTDVRNIATGEGQISFQSEHVDADGKPLSIPNIFIITVPVFARATEYYRIMARLRYRKTAGGLVFWYDLWRADRVFDAAFNEAVELAAAETGLPLFIGKDEGSSLAVASPT